MPEKLPYHTQIDLDLLEAMKDGTQQEYLLSNGVHGLDGPWSQQSQQLKTQFNAKGFHFNRWWLLTPPDWSCSVCKREKIGIARTDKNGFLSGHLHEHHDHMTDIVENLFAEVSSNRKQVIATEQGKKFIRKIANSISAYDATVICSDCNAADATAKKLIGTPKDFSFSPSEIESFISAYPNTAHQVDKTSASKAWQKQEDTFQSRMSLARQLAQIAAENQQWYQPTNQQDLPNNIEKKAQRHLTAAASRRNETIDLLDYLAAFPPPPPRTDLTKWRKKKWKTQPKPTNGDIKHLVAVASNSHWGAVTNDWKCPCCGRLKKETVHKNNKGEWSFSVRTSSWNSDEGRVIETVCNDCFTTSIQLAKEIEVDRSCFKISEIASVAISQPNQRHRFESDEIILQILSGVEQRKYW